MGLQKGKPTSSTLEMRRAAELLTQGMSTSARRQFLLSEAGQNQVQEAVHMAAHMTNQRADAPLFGGTLFGKTLAPAQNKPDFLAMACITIRENNQKRVEVQNAASQAVAKLVRAAKKEDAELLQKLLAKDAAKALALCQSVAEAEKDLAAKRALLRLSSLATLTKRYPQLKDFLAKLSLQLPLPPTLPAMTRTHWKLSDAQGTTLAHVLADIGILPRKFNQWQMKDGQGRTVRQIFDARGMWAVHQGTAPDKKMLIHQALRQSKKGA